ncbi:MAG: ATPase [Deltaproteobacteria bacterium]|nr:ATPase [Deltaproteobacteria bacterium]MBW1959163.1 ATPase [Deltaproteobacteria bacterium]MBW2015127.1 ATPase [Deltaproteobacteria bacterium]MBW2090012.1 ATPase [Deltaproteobacteria bacterium]
MKAFRKMHPGTILLSSYLVTIGIGSFLLLLPASTVTGTISFIDAIFTATSAVCVTGLIVVDTGSYFTLFGQYIILVLIQLGGLGVMTVSVTIFLMIGKQVSFKQRMAMQDLFAHTPREDINQLIKSILWFTVIAELSGIVLLTVHWTKEYPLTKAIYMGVFHAVSAFCNAGFSLFTNSFMDYTGDVFLNVVICTLIIFGGIGFPVVYDIYKTAFRSQGKRIKLSVQTKTVLMTTGILIMAGMAVFWSIEQNVSMRGYSFIDRLLPSLFQSVTCRTAGFNTINIAALGNATLAFMIFLMVVGASPGSCGGGIKTTTLAVLGKFAWSRMRNKIRVNLFKKSIPKDTVAKSISLVVISMTIILAALFLLLLSTPDNLSSGKDHSQFLSYLFEVVSAFGTVGLSMGATNQMTCPGKLLIIIIMLIGRVGVLTFSYLIAGVELTKGIEYAEENIMIG